MISWGHRHMTRSIYNSHVWYIYIGDGYIHIYMCMCIYIHMSIHTHTYIHIYMYKMLLNKNQEKSLPSRRSQPFDSEERLVPLVPGCRIPTPAFNADADRSRWRRACLGMEAWGWRMGWRAQGREWRTCATGEMTFGDTRKSSFCIKHKLLVQFKKIIFCFLLRLGRKVGEGEERREGGHLPFQHVPWYRLTTQPPTLGPFGQVRIHIISV